MVSTGARQVEPIAALLKSTASDKEQLALAAEIVDYRILESEQIRALPNTKHERVLKWILSKIGQQDPVQGCALLDPDTYSLLSFLLLQMPAKVALRQLQHADLLRSTSKCLQYTQKELAEHKDHIRDGSDKAINEAKDSFVVGPINAFERLKAVCQVLYAIQQMPYSGENIPLFSQFTRNATKMSFEQAAAIVESGLLCIFKCIRIGIWRVATSLETRFVTALTAMWSLASETSISKENDLRGAILFAKHCLLPSFQLAIERPNLGLDNFIMEHCLLPLRQHGLTDDEKLSESLSFMFVSMSGNSLPTDEGSEAMDVSMADGIQETRHNTIPKEFDAILLVVKISSRLDEGVKLKNKDILTRWYREMFITLATFLNINTTVPQRRSLSIGESLAMSRLLGTFQEAGISPGSDILSNIILYYTDQGPLSFSQSTWEIIKICMELQHEIISDFTNQSIQIIEHIFAAIALADGINPATSMGSDEVQQGALSFLLEPLLDAVVKSRKPSQLLPFWQNHVEVALRKIVESDPPQERRNPEISFWELDSVQHIIRRKLIDAMSLNERLALFTNLAADVSKFLQYPQDQAALYAKIIVLSTTITSFEVAGMQLSNSQRQLQHSQVWELYVSIGKYYTSSQNSDRKYHLLGLLDELKALCMQEICPPDVIGLDNDLIELFGMQIRQALGSNGEQKYYKCASAAWSSLVLRLQNDVSGHEILTQTVQDTFSAVIASLIGLEEEPGPNRLADAVEDSSNNARRLHTEKAMDFIRGCIRISLDHPKIYGITQLTDLRNFVSNLYSRGRLSSRFPNSSPNDHASDLSNINPWRNLWNQFNRSIVASEVSSVYRAIHQAQINGLIDSGSTLLQLPQTDIGTRLALYQFSLQQLGISSFNSISKEDRGKIVNQLVADLCSEAPIGNWFLMSLELLCKLMERPSRLMMLVSDTYAIWNLFERLEDKLSVDCFDSLHNIARHLLTYWIAEDKGKDSDIKEFISASKERIRQTNKQSRSVGSAIIITTAITLFHESIDQVNLIPQDLQLRFLENQVQSLRNIFPSSTFAIGSGYSTMYAVLDNICTLPLSITKKYKWYSEITTSKQQVEKISTKDYLEAIQDSLKDTLQNIALGEIKLTIIMCWFRVQDVLARTSNEQGDFGRYLGLELALFPHDVQRRRLKELQDIFKDLPADRKALSLTSLLSISPGSSSEKIRYLHRLTSIPISGEERAVYMKLALQRSLNFGLETSTTSEQSENVAHALKLVHSVLDQNPWAVNQYSTDRSLSTITLLTGQESKIKITAAKPSHLVQIFAELIQILSTLFQKHRRKIGGRWALVLDALKGILRCLFEPFPDLRRRDAIPQPAWMQEVRSGHIRRRDIEAFSRLLSTICDPTYQALRTRQPSQNGTQALNDASKAARAIAGQHMQHFIIELCSLQLRGKMVHRDALKPGLYAIFDAMSQDVLKALNESLDAQSRIIFKSIYDDWKNHGKWTGS